MNPVSDLLIDVNLLLYAKITNYPQHVATHAWLEAQFKGGGKIGLPWLSLLGFIRIVTNPHLFDNNPLSVTEAWAQVEQWLSSPNVYIPQPTERHPEILSHLLCVTEAKGNLVSDAHLAALAIEHDLLLCSADNDFAKFPNLNWLNPLKAS
jgi:uncharacterized protein